MRGAAHRVLIAVVALAATTLVPAHAVPSAAAAAPVPDRSVVTWAASADRLGEAPSDRSYRLVVRTSAGGSGMRFRVSNAY
ncbi:SGNH/GDSL hydrolase family protein, partial [Streptomyces sp. NPDC059744]